MGRGRPENEKAYYGSMVLCIPVRQARSLAGSTSGGDRAKAPRVSTLWKFLCDPGLRFYRGRVCVRGWGFNF